MKESRLAWPPKEKFLTSPLLCTLFCEFENRYLLQENQNTFENPKGKAWNMLAPTFMGMASSKFSCSHRQHPSFFRLNGCPTCSNNGVFRWVVALQIQENKWEILVLLVLIINKKKETHFHNASVGPTLSNF